MLIQTEPLWSLDAFEPTISSETMMIHVYQLHQAYIKKLNQKFKHSDLLEIPPSEVLSNLTSYLSDRNREFYRNQMGGHVCHSLFWQVITPHPIAPDEDDDLEFLEDFGLTQELLNKTIVEEAKKRFGSGWVWGALTRKGDFQVYTTSNHDTPYMRKQKPLFCLDLWEHAYFLDVHGDRKKWIDTIPNYLDLYAVNRIYKNFLKGEDLIDHWCFR